MNSPRWPPTSRVLADVHYFDVFVSVSASGGLGKHLQGTIQEVRLRPVEFCSNLWCQDWVADCTCRFFVAQRTDQLQNERKALLWAQQHVFSTEKAFVCSLFSWSALGSRMCFLLSMKSNANRRPARPCLFPQPHFKNLLACWSLFPGSKQTPWRRKGCIDDKTRPCRTERTGFRSLCPALHRFPRQDLCSLWRHYCPEIQGEFYVKQRLPRLKLEWAQKKKKGHKCVFCWEIEWIERSAFRTGEQKRKNKVTTHRNRKEREQAKKGTNARVTTSALEWKREMYLANNEIVCGVVRTCRHRRSCCETCWKQKDKTTW